MKIQHINGDELKEFVQLNNLVLVDFFADWCGPCKMIAPVLEDFTEEMGDKVSIAKINIDENETLARELRIMSIPTILVYKGGEIVEKTVGYKSIGQMRELVSKYI